MRGEGRVVDRRRLGRVKFIFTEIVDRFLYQLTYSRMSGVVQVGKGSPQLAV